MTTKKETIDQKKEISVITSWSGESGLISDQDGAEVKRQGVFDQPICCRGMKQ